MDLWAALRHRQPRRALLGYGLDLDPPDSSSLSVIRKRLTLDPFRCCHEFVLAGSRKGRHLGVDFSVMEANASADRNMTIAARTATMTERSCPPRTKSVRTMPKPCCFDSSRQGQKTSGLSHKLEHVTDLESGDIVRAEVRAGGSGVRPSSRRGSRRRQRRSTGSMKQLASQERPGSQPDKRRRISHRGTDCGSFGVDF